MSSNNSLALAALGLVVVVGGGALLLMTMNKQKQAPIPVLSKTSTTATAVVSDSSSTSTATAAAEDTTTPQPKLEIFHVVSTAGKYMPLETYQSTMTKNNWRLATAAEVEAAVNKKADWCSTGFIQDGKPVYPSNLTRSGCGTAGKVNPYWPEGPNKELIGGVNIVGVKPPNPGFPGTSTITIDDVKVLPFSNTSVLKAWNEP